MAKTIDMTSYLLGKGKGGGTPAVLEEKSVEITSQDQVIEPSEGYNGMSSVSVSGISSSVDSNILSSNIKKGITILGITGTYGSEIVPPEAGTLQSIAFQSQPTKTTYNEGETFDPEGCVVLGLYSNGLYYDVTMLGQFIVNTPLTWQDTNVVFSYEGMTLNIVLTIISQPVPAPANTMALYHFDDNLNNEVGGTATSSYSGYSQGKFGKSYAQTQSGAAALKMNNITLTNADLQSNNYTFEFWIKCTNSSMTNYYEIYRFYNASSVYSLFDSVAISTTGLKLKANPGSWDYPLASSCIVDNVPTSFNITDYHHVAVVITAGKYQCYLDGQKACHGNVNNNTTYNGFWGIGINSTAFYIDEFLCCEGAKYTDEFVPNHAPYYIEGGE